MTKWFWILAFLFPLTLAASPTYVSYQNWCMVGGQTVSVQGLSSTTNVQASFKSCTVTVHIHGGALATLFSDSAGTSLSNPFTAQTNGQYQFYIDSTVATEYDVTTSGGTPAFPTPVTLADVFIFSPGGGGGGGGVNNCATNGSLAYYVTSGSSVSCIGAELTFATSTLTGGTGLTVDLSAISELRVPVIAFGAAAVPGDILFDSTNNNYHAYSASADHIVVTAAQTPNNLDCPVWVVSGGTVLLGNSSGPCALAAGSAGDVQMNDGASGLSAAHINDNGTNIYISEPTSYFIATAGAGGVTQNLLAAADSSNPTKFVLPVAGNCGIGFALTSAVSGNTFLLGNAVQDEYTGIADNTVTAGHILIGGTVTPGRVKDSGGTQITGVSVGTCVVGKALNSGNAGDPIHVLYMGLGTFGTSGTATYTGSPGAGHVAVFTGTAGQISDSGALTHTCDVIWKGTGGASALQTGDDAVADQSCLNKIGVTETITAVYCRSDAGSNTTTVNPTFGATGTGTTICSGALTCGSSGAYSATCTVSNGALTDGSNINPVMGGVLSGTSIHMVVITTASK